MTIKAAISNGNTILEKNEVNSTKLLFNNPNFFNYFLKQIKIKLNTQIKINGPITSKTIDVHEIINLIRDLPHPQQKQIKNDLWVLQETNGNILNYLSIIYTGINK